MKLRFVAPAAAAALALGVLAPTAAAQGSIDLESVGEIGGESVGEIGGESLDDLGGDGSLDLGTPEDAQPCELPDLGGSVDALSPIIGTVINVPGSVVGSASGSLGSIDNPLNIIGGGEIIDQTGSLATPICEFLGGTTDPDDGSDTGSLGSAGSSGSLGS